MPVRYQTLARATANLAKVGVVGSNPIARSNFIKGLAFFWTTLFSMGYTRATLRYRLKPSVLPLPKASFGVPVPILERISSPRLWPTSWNR